MNTPICEFVNNYVNRETVRAHMPGHKGRGETGAEAFDITEIPGAGVLYADPPQVCHSEERSDEESLYNTANEILRCAQNDNGVCLDAIAESENNAAALFGTAKTLYSTEGSSLAIRAMLYLVRLQATLRGQTPRILAGRNAHKTFVTAAALLEIEVDWLLPEDGSVLSCDVTAEALEARLAALPQLPTAVYITSPDYLGNLADVTALSHVCHSREIMLLVDNAHGAYLNFLPENRHPIALGADLCCDSAHKTLPVLTGGAYLHLAKSCPKDLVDAAENAMRLFASTSPSYLILQSLDALNPSLAGSYPAKLAVFCAQVGGMKQRLQARGYSFCGSEPLKLTVDAKDYGYLGTDLAELLDRAGVVCEFADPDVFVLMLTPELGENGLHKIETALLNIPRRAPLPHGIPRLPEPVFACSPREALFSPCVRVPAEACAGRVLAQPSVSCPPAVPIAVCGERLQRAHAGLFSYYGVKEIFVVA